MASKRRILITTGDGDGIGLEVTRKALKEIGPSKNVDFSVYRCGNSRRLSLPGFQLVTVASLAEAMALPSGARSECRLVEIVSAESPAKWVEEAAAACCAGQFAALVTAPLSKTTILKAGMTDIGHTEILARVSGCQDLFMGFFGRHFSVVLATGHLSLRKAVDSLSSELVQRAVQAAEELRQILPAGSRRRPLALVGLNPHAGEGGLMGDDDERLRQWLKALRPKYRVEGPLVPDAAFLPHNWPRHSVYIACYHDQGLIPFKLAHGFDGGVHLTLGLSFVRTSVDHGTAKDLFGKNRAKSGSMRDAILTAMRLSKGVKK